MAQTAVYMESAKISRKGQITIPKDIRKMLGVENGDRVAFVSDGNTVRMMNPAIYALKIFQMEMAGEAEKAGIHSEEDVIEMVRKMRRGEEDW